jgi:histidyl-tRNA synthetase
VIFEIYIPELDIALGGGGRYDKLIEAFGGQPTPSVGVAHGLDRIVMALQMQNAPISTDCTKRVLVLSVNETLKVEALKIAQLLRKDGITVEFEVMGRKMGKALEDADKRKVDFAVIVGERELKEGSVMVKNLATREQILVQIKDLPQKIKG